MLQTKLWLSNFFNRGIGIIYLGKLFLSFIVNTTNCSLNTIQTKNTFLQDLSESEFYGDLVYTFRKIVGKPKFPEHFSKVVIWYKQNGYNIDVIKQSAC